MDHLPPRCCPYLAAKQGPLRGVTNPTDRKDGFVKQEELEAKRIWPFRSAEGLIVAAFFAAIGGGMLWVTAKDFGADDPTSALLMCLGGSVEGIGLLLAVIAGRVLQAGEQYKLELDQEEGDLDEQLEED